MRPDDALLIDELRQAHGVHTLVLYGSHARGDATAGSDLDVAGFADVERTVRDARRWRGVYLDAFVYPTAVAGAPPDEEMLKLVGGRILLDERGLAEPLLVACAALDREPVKPLTEDEARMRRVWAHKSLARARRGDPEADYRRHWLCYELLHDYFALRHRRYRGPKLALAELERSSPTTYALFRRGLAPGADLDALADLVIHVAGPLPGAP